MNALSSVKIHASEGQSSPSYNPTPEKASQASYSRKDILLIPSYLHLSSPHLPASVPEARIRDGSGAVHG